MRRTSVAQAKAHFSALLYLAERRKKRILILRHGKPVAAIVPADLVKIERPRMTAEAFEALVDRMITATAEMAPEGEGGFDRGRLGGVH